MRKYLAFLLIAVIACSTFDEDMNSYWNTDKIIKYYQMLKDKGILDIIINILKNQGFSAAKQACCRYIKHYCEACQEILYIIK